MFRRYHTRPLSVRNVRRVQYCEQAQHSDTHSRIAPVDTSYHPTKISTVRRFMRRLSSTRLVATMNPDLSQLSQAELIDRCTKLEQQVQGQIAQIAELSTASQENDKISSRASNKKQAKQFDASRYATRHIALKFSYLGHQYNGFEHANRCFTPLPTIEEVLWKALRKARLISPPVPEGADDSYEVVYHPKERESKYFLYGKTKPEHEPNKMRLDISWDGCQYSKCGRTDRGVSAFGQVIGIRLRSNAPASRKETNADSEEPQTGHDAAGKIQDEQAPTFDPIKDELPYMYMLNTLLPPDIRILAWCPFPPEGFDARFSCRERRYKYFFTNPAFCPTPGPVGLLQSRNTGSAIREGWLNIEKMREAAKKLVGLHDYRNLCQIDASKQMPSCERRINFADVQELESSPAEFMADPDLNAFGTSASANGHIENAPGPKTYAIVVHGSAFLWHQVRCIAAVLFLVGQGLESPDVIDKLLDVEKTPGRPNYTMADDAPLVLWDCIFPGDEGCQGDSLRWIYAGDEAAMPTMTSKGDGKYGPGGLVDELWAQWRDVKIREAQINGLLSLAMSSGDKSSIQRGGYRDPTSNKTRNQKIFEGASRVKLAGQYTPLLKRHQMEPLEILNAKYLATTKGTRRFPRKLASHVQDSDVNLT